MSNRAVPVNKRIVTQIRPLCRKLAVFAEEREQRIASNTGPFSLGLLVTSQTWIKHGERDAGGGARGVFVIFSVISFLLLFYDYYYYFHGLRRIKLKENLQNIGINRD